MPRFYCDPASTPKLDPGSIVTLPEVAANHAARVLRLQAGACVTLFNGDGHDYACELLTVGKREVIAKVLASQRLDNESALDISLVQAISSGERMDYTLQKAVEMGVTAIQPVSSQRSVVKLSGERVEKRREHWQNVVCSACEQCGRARVPQVALPVPLSQWLETAPDFARRILLTPAAAHSLHDLARPDGRICLLIGAEGGLSTDELALAMQHGFNAVRLGPRVLRTETAALAAIAALQTLWGDFLR